MLAAHANYIMFRLLSFSPLKTSIKNIQTFIGSAGEIDTRCLPGGGGVPIMAYTGRLRLIGVSFSCFRYMKG